VRRSRTKYNGLGLLVQITSSEETLRNGEEAVQCAKKACRITGFRDATMLATLAASYAEANRFPQAAAAAERALRMQNEMGELQRAATTRQLLPLYRVGKSWHETAPLNKPL
jgi:hypothetical protein